MAVAAIFAARKGVVKHSAALPRRRRNFGMCKTQFQKRRNGKQSNDFFHSARMRRSPIWNSHEKLFVAGAQPQTSAYSKGRKAPAVARVELFRFVQKYKQGQNVPSFLFFQILRRLKGLRRVPSFCIIANYCAVVAVL